jgi:electron transport complex protein RnfD
MNNVEPVTRRVPSRTGPPDELSIAVSPHLHAGTSTTGIMLSVAAALLPAGIWGVYVFGMPALAVLLASVAASLVAEAIIGGLLGRFTLTDGSALVTGLLVGYNMPPAVPLYIPAIASVFAIAVVKWTFGGLGRNWMNPALAGRVFVMFSWTGPMTTWLVPRTAAADAVTGPSPLGFLKSGLLDFQGQAAGPLQFLADRGYSFSRLDAAVTGWLNQALGLSLPQGYLDLFLGNIPGCIGEVSALLLLAGVAALLARKIITWEVPAAYLGSFGLLVWVFGGTRLGTGLLTGDVIFHLLAGGLMLGALYMATDMVTSPLTRRGMVIFGAGAGFFTFLIRFYGGLPEGVSLAIILMNMFVPLIDRYTRPVKFGAVRKAKA